MKSLNSIGLKLTYLVGRALGHANTSSIELYAYPGDTAARSIAEKVAGRFIIGRDKW